MRPHHDRWLDGADGTSLARYTKTSLMKPHIVDILISKGIEFADIDDCTLAVLRVACDLNINGIDIGQKFTRRNH